jgi:hypothetical protein
MTSPKPDDTPIPLTDDLGDVRALLTPERDPITGARVSGARQRAAKQVLLPSAPAPRRRPPRWAIPAGVGVLALVGASVAFASTRHSDAPSAPTTVTEPRPTTTAAVEPSGPLGPLAGFEGQYRITVENVYISGASGRFTTGRLERSGSTVTARYDDASGSGSATVQLPEGPATVTCAPDEKTCTMQWSGAFPALIDGNLGHVVLLRSSDTPLNVSECGLLIPSDGSITPKFGLVGGRPQVQDFRLTTGSEVSSADGCANAVVIGYEIIATRAP